MAVTVKNVVFRNVILCASCKTRHFGGIHHLHHKGDKNRRARNNSNNNVVPSSPILATLMVEVTCSSETSVLTGVTQYNIPEGGIHQQ
jgi:hypothetical protein